MSEFQKKVTEEIKRARSQYGDINSLHEGYAVLLEEVDEFWDEVRKKGSVRDYTSCYNELVQIAAIAEVIAEDIINHKK